MLLDVGGPRGAAGQHRHWDPGESVAQEKKARHIDGHTDQHFQWGWHSSHAVRGGDLVVLLIPMLLVPWSIVHIQIIRQFCQERRRIWVVALYTPSSLHHSQPPAPVWTGAKLPFGFFLYLEREGFQRQEGEGVFGGCVVRWASQKYSFTESTAIGSESVSTPPTWLHQHSRMFVGPLQHLPGRSVPLNWRSFSSELTWKYAMWTNISVLVCWWREGESGGYVVCFPLAPYSRLIFLSQEICWVSVEGQGNLLLKVVFIFPQYFLFFSFLSHKSNKTSPNSHILLSKHVQPFDMVIQHCHLRSSQLRTIQSS